MRLLVSFFIVMLAKGVINEKPYEGIAEVEALVKAVTQQPWTEDEASCRDAVLAMLNGIKNSTLWATWMWDAMQRPTGTLYGSLNHLGNFDQCLNPPWPQHVPHRAQYCLIDLRLSDGTLHKSRKYFDPYESTATYINTISERGRHMNAVTWGLCVPSQCSVESVSTLARHMARATHLAPMGEDPGINVNYCHLAGETRSYGFGDQVFWLMLLCFMLAAITFTYYRQYYQSASNSLVTEVAKSFCLRTNYAELFEEKPREICAMNGIRFLTTFLVVLAHVYMFTFGIGIINALDVDRDISSSNGIYFHHMDLIVDTFFALSGLLHIKSLLTAKPDRPQSFVKIVCKRYVRLTVALSVAVFYLAAVSADVDNGPLWRKFSGGEQSICIRSWWKCLLMLTLNIEDMCYIISWYVPCDFQLTILGTIIFFVYKKNSRNGFKLFGVVSVFSILLPAFITYRYQLKAVVINSLQDVANLRQIKYVDYVYTNSYTRAGAYMVGMAMGYFMTMYEPHKYKKTIPKIWSFLGTLLAVSTMTFTLTLGTIFYDTEFSALVPISVTMDRIIWATAVCSILGFCVYGDLPLINDFLSWSCFRPLGRLSYGIFMIHAIILQRYIFSARTPFKYSHFIFLIVGVGIATISAIASMLLWLFIEAPVINITNYLLRNKTPNAECQSEATTEVIQNGVKKEL